MPFRPTPKLSRRRHGAWLKNPMLHGVGLNFLLETGGAEWQEIPK